MISRIFKEQKGNTFVLVALALSVLMGFAALSIDVGMMLTARNQLQSAVDAAALAGASGLIVSQQEATSRAITFAGQNDCINQPVIITAANVSFPTADRIRVQANRLVNLFFSNVLGMATADIAAVAVAELGNLVGSPGIKPWAIPDLDFTLGEQVTLKAGELGAPATNPGFFYPVDFPPINRGDPITGAQAYADNIINGSQDEIFIGDELQVEPGNMIGPTAHGINELISQDPNARWDGNGVADSAYPGDSSPRVIKVPLYDDNYPPDSGRNSVTVVALAAFFLEDIQGRNVTGRFMEIITSGTQGGGSTTLKGVKLVL
jgi:hypothetical protein